MIDIGNNKSINPLHVVSCELDVTHYVNGSESRLYIKMDDGSCITRNHGYGIDIYKIKDTIDNWKPEEG